MKNFKRILYILVVTILLVSCENVSQYSPNCKGKVVDKITESPTTTKIYFTDGSSYTTSSNDLVFVTYKNKQ